MPLRFGPTALPGVLTVVGTAEDGAEPLFDAAAAAAAGLTARLARAELWRLAGGARRGLFCEADQVLLGCAWGEVRAVAVDLRPASPAFRRSIALVLAPGRGLAVPAGCAWGIAAPHSPASVLVLAAAAARQALVWEDPAVAAATPACGPAAN